MAKTTALLHPFPQQSNLLIIKKIGFFLLLFFMLCNRSLSLPVFRGDGVWYLTTSNERVYECFASKSLKPDSWTVINPTTTSNLKIRGNFQDGFLIEQFDRLLYTFPGGRNKEERTIGSNWRENFELTDFGFLDTETIYVITYSGFTSKITLYDLKSGDKLLSRRMRGHITKADWSPKHQLMLLEVHKETISHVLLWDFKSGSQKNISRKTHFGYSPSWSPDGSLIAYLETNRNGRMTDLVTQSLDNNQVLSRSPVDLEAKTTQLSWLDNTTPLLFNTVKQSIFWLTKKGRFSSFSLELPDSYKKITYLRFHPVYKSEPHEEKTVVDP